MKDVRFCPHCGIDLYVDITPFVGDDSRKWRCDRALGIEIWGVYDGVLFYACPECHRTWHHWTAQYAPNLWAAAEKHRAQFTAVMRAKPCSE